MLITRNRIVSVLILAIYTSVLVACRSLDDRDQESGLRVSAEVSPEADVGTKIIIGSFEIQRFEIWPYSEPQPLFPNKIIRAGSTRATALGCMRVARDALATALKDPPISMLDLQKARGLTRFVSWNNDYTGATADDLAPARYRKPWVLGRTEIKWVSETKRDGTCVIPTRVELDRLATRCLESWPDC